MKNASKSCENDFTCIFIDIAYSFVDFFCSKLQNM